jgi:glutathione peroxidase
MRVLLAIAATAVVLAACKKEDAPKVMYGDTAKKELAVNLPAAGPPPPAAAAPSDFSRIWDVPVKTLKGAPTSLAAYKGKAVLVVNVASQCGLTPQYAALEAVQDRYASKGFTVVGFPCNQFGSQEPGTAEEIETFCSTNYGVTFPIMEKIEVNGAARSPVYAHLTPIADANGHTGDIRWNFEKFLISADGTKVTRFAPKTSPDDPIVIGAIEASLPR